MKRVTVVIAVLVLFAGLLAVAPIAACADSINLYEPWYIKISNFSLMGNAGFDQFWTYSYSSTSLVEASLQDVNPNTPRLFQNLVFDFHAGQVSTDDIVLFYPYATVGSSWSGMMSFNWEIRCNNPQVVLSVYTSDPMQAPGYTRVWWTAPSGSSSRSGSASFSVSTMDLNIPAFRISFVPVPEPGTIFSLALPLAAVALQLRRRAGK